MKTYKVILTRAYAIEVKAKNIDDAKHYSEFFIGDPQDRSTEEEQNEHRFKIGELEMVMNEAMEAEEVV